MKNQEQIITTDFGFRDISVPLREKTLEEIRKYDIIRDVWITKEKEESHKGIIEKVYYFESHEYNIHGRIFPQDEIIFPKRQCDIIVQNWKDGSSLNLDAHIYHDLYKGEELKVRISRKVLGKDPSFKIFNHIAGFVKDPENGLYEKIQEGSRLLVEIFDLKKSKKGKYIKVWPLDFFKNEEK